MEPMAWPGLPLSRQPIFPQPGSPICIQIVDPEGKIPEYCALDPPRRHWMPAREAPAWGKPDRDNEGGPGVKQSVVSAVGRHELCLPAHHPGPHRAHPGKRRPGPAATLQLSALRTPRRGSAKPSPCSTLSSQSRMPRASASPHCPAPGCQAAHPGGQGPDERQGADHRGLGRPAPDPGPVAGGPGGQHGQAGGERATACRRHPGSG